jgi:hypothetical protein
VGNPPYVTIGGKEDMMTSSNEMNYYLGKFISAKYKPNLYSFFYEKSYTLLKRQGLVSYIVPRTFLDNKYYSSLREYFVANSQIKIILKLDYEVFESATTGGTCIIIFEKNKPNENIILGKEIKSTKLFYSSDFLSIKQTQILFGEFKIFSIRDDSSNSLLEKIIKNSQRLDSFCSVNNGVNTGNAAKILLSTEKISALHRKILEGKNINRYSINWGGLWINYDKDIKKKINIKDLDTRQAKIDLALRNEVIFTTSKIIIRQTSDKIIACLDSDKYISRHSTHCIVNDKKKTNLSYLLGILNSKLINYCYQKFIPEKGKAFAEVKGVNVKQLPIAVIDLSNKLQKESHDKIVSLVTQMLAMKKQTPKTEKDKQFLENTCKSLDYQIDNEVYKLYNLTPEEIEIVESASK